MKTKTTLLLNLLLALTLLLSGCGGQGPKPVEPVGGLPTGTGDFPWWNDAVFYEIFVRSFFDSDGDGIGDFNGLTARLDYLNDGDPKTDTDLGIHGIWLMPIFPSTSYHGYDVTDYYDVHPEFGTMEEFKTFLDQAHQRGIKVIIDMVLNHTSARHPWFRESQTVDSPYRDWYIWSNTRPTFSGPWGQNVWHRAASGYYYGVFWDQMPDLNHENPEVRAEVEKITQFWLQEVGVDGFRLDGARYMVEEGRETADTPSNQAWHQEFRALSQRLSPEALILGEVWTTSFAVAPYIKNDALDLAFEFDLASAFRSSASAGRATSAFNQMQISARLFPAGQFAPFLTNHDQNRVMNEMGGSLHKARVAAAMLLTSPGVPFLYYGEEIGMSGSKPDEYIRTPMQWSDEPGAGFTTGTPWIRINSDYSAVNVAALSGEDGSLWRLYRDLIQARNAHAALRIGEAHLPRSASPAVFSVLRSSPQETVLVVINLGTEAVSEYSLDLDRGPLSGAYRAVPIFNSASNDKFAELSASSQGGFAGYQPLPELAPGQVLLLQLNSR
jgi:alpha-amylase